MKPFSRILVSLGLLLLAVSSAFPARAGTNLPALDLKNAFPGLKFARPLWMEEVPDGSGRFIVVEQGGRVYLVPRNRNPDDTKAFLDITDRRPYQENEEGLLAFAFHPQFKTNGLFYIFYSQQNPKRSVLSEIRVSKTDPDKADLGTERILLQVPKRYWNHNGSTLLFGPDGYLYFGLGDGGAGGDPHNNGQNLQSLLAKMLRIDVNSRSGNLPYGIPADNPFATAGNGTRPEIWAYGLRNPWRMSFDRATRELWVGDVGQDKWEEIDVVTKAGNYGWSVREGFHPFKTQAVLAPPIDPVIEYAHNSFLAAQSKFPKHGLGISVTGGYVYRGEKIPALKGVYVYGDYQLGTIWGLRYENGRLTADDVLVRENPLRPIPSFAQDLSGELYVISFDGNIYQLVLAK